MNRNFCEDIEGRGHTYALRKSTWINKICEPIQRISNKNKQKMKEKYAYN